jgi:hypothetical protein
MSVPTPIAAMMVAGNPSPAKGHRDAPWRHASAGRAIHPRLPHIVPTVRMRALG